MYFSVLDQKSGYYSIRMHPDSRAKTAFSTRSQHWEFLSMPFGVMNGPSTFCYLVSKLFHKELQEYALIYLDDLIILSKDFPTHLSRLQNVFTKIRNAKLRLNGEKSHFALSEVKYLGHRFSRECISMDESKVEAIKTYPRPSNVKELRSFLGLCNYWKRFVCSYSAISHPLRVLLQKGVPYLWGEEQEQAFNTLKNKLCQSPILAFPDMQKPFLVTTDACKTGLGYMLSQLDSEGRERVISYNGRATRSYEKNYTATELELCAIIQALVTYHPYLANQKFEVVTDHVSLKYLRDLKLGNSRLIRWSLLLSQYQFTIRHVPGKKLQHLDALSRRHYPPDDTQAPLLNVEPNTYLLSIRQRTQKQSTKQSRPSAAVARSQSIAVDDTDQSPDEEMSAAVEQVVGLPPSDGVVGNVDLSPPEPINLHNQKHDKFFADIIHYLQDGTLPSDKQQARRIILQSEYYVIDNGDVLMHLGINRHKRLKRVDPIIRQLCVPPEMREHLIANYHDQLMHAGIDKTFLTIKNKYYWTGAYKQVQDYINYCTTCQTIKTVPHQRKPPLHSWEPADLFHRLHVDHFGPILYKGQQQSGPKSKDIYKYILVLIDALSLNVDLVPAKSTSAEETALLIFKHFVCRYGRPAYICSDRGTAFCALLSAAFYRRCGIRHLKTSPRNPASNSAAELVNKVIIRALRATCTDSKDWVEKLPLIEMAHRASVVTTLGVSPFRVLYGVDMKLPIDGECIPNMPKHVTAQNFLASFEPQLELLRELLKENAKEAREKNAAYYNRTAKEPTFKVGDSVYLLNEFVRKDQPPHKLGPQFIGPFVIVSDSGRYTYKLQSPITGRFIKPFVHAKKLKLARLNRHLLRARSSHQTDTSSQDLADQTDLSTSQGAQAAQATGNAQFPQIAPYPSVMPDADAASLTAPQSAPQAMSADRRDAQLTSMSRPYLTAPSAAPSSLTHAVGSSVSSEPTSINTTNLVTDSTVAVALPAQTLRRRSPARHPRTPKISQQSSPRRATDAQLDTLAPGASAVGTPAIGSAAATVSVTAQASSASAAGKQPAQTAGATKIDPAAVDDTTAQSSALLRTSCADSTDTPETDIAEPPLHSAALVQPKSAASAMCPSALEQAKDSASKMAQTADSLTAKTSLDSASTCLSADLPSDLPAPPLTSMAQAHPADTALEAEVASAVGSLNKPTTSTLALDPAAPVFHPATWAATTQAHEQSLLTPATLTAAQAKTTLGDMQLPASANFTLPAYQPQAQSITTEHQAPKAASVYKRSQSAPVIQSALTPSATTATVKELVALSNKDTSSQLSSQQQQIPELPHQNQPESSQSKTLPSATERGRPVKIIKKKMIGKKIHFLTRFSDSTKSIWVKPEDLPPAFVAQYLAMTYEKQRKSRSRRRLEFGQY